MDIKCCVLCGGNLETNGIAISFCVKCHAVYRFHPESTGNFVLTVFKLGNNESPATAKDIARFREIIECIGYSGTHAEMIWANVPLVIEQIKLMV